MIKIDVKPLSVNSAYKGRKFKTKEHDLFKILMASKLPKTIELPPPPYCIHFEFGLSSALSDGDNCIKLTQDSIADKYGFNDRLIKRCIVDVEKVKKGSEYIKFKIENLTK